MQGKPSRVEGATLLILKSKLCLVIALVVAMSSTNIATRRLTGPTMYREIAVITPADTVLAPPAQRFVERLRASFS